MTTEVSPLPPGFVLRSKDHTPGISVGFCSGCGFIREDIDGYPMSDCLCTAKLRHAEGCRYIQACGMMVSVGWCEAHGLDACPACDCTCGATGPYRRYLEAKTRQEFLQLLGARP